MLIINAAPIDQSGRTLSLAKHLAQQNMPITLAVYVGLRKPEPMHQNINCVFLREIATDSRIWLFRWALLAVKMVYLSLMGAWLVWQEYYKLQQCSKVFQDTYLFHHLRTPAVICVVPPTPTVVLPLLCARALGMGVAVDWHRIVPGVLETFNLLLAQWVVNIAVTQSMEEYFRSRGIDQVRTVTDLFLMEIMGKPRRAKSDRESFFAYLEKKYPSYRDRLRGLDLRKRIGVCSTSCSEEEDMPGLFQALNACTVSGTLILTTKKPLAHPHRCLQIVQLFLDYEDYLQLLQIADFGISTHQCHYDFPMKIVDYIQSSLPVIAHGSTLHTCPAPYAKHLKTYAHFAELGGLLQEEYLKPAGR